MVLSLENNLYSCYERARVWIESHKLTDGEPIEIRRAKAFLVDVYDGELI